MVSNGENSQWEIPIVNFMGAFVVIAMLLWWLATVPCEKISTRVKMILTAPLLMSMLLLPVLYTVEDKAIPMMVGCYGFTAFLRYVEVMYAKPLLEGKPAFVPARTLHVETWSCIRQFPEKEPSKDKKFWHILLPLTIHMLIANATGSWFATFSWPDVQRIESEHPVFFFVFFAGAALYFTAEFNATGYILQLMYCIFYEGGTYAPEQYHVLMNYPMLATSINDIWSYRWHQLLRGTWLAFPFRPVRTLVTWVLGRTKSRSPPEIAIALATLSVFFISGVMHEYLVFCNVGWSAYRAMFIGQEWVFFMLHGVTVLAEKQLAKYMKLPSWIGRLWTVAFFFITFPLFLNGFAYKELWQANPYRLLTPFFLDNVWRRFSILHPYCGSLLF